MKTQTIKLFLISAIFSITFSFSQSVEGKLSIKGLTKGTIINQKTPVALFNAFKEGTYSINFNFKATGINNRNIVLFDMKTTVKHNGSTISQTTRGGWPLLSGDTSIGAEGFDFIPALEKLSAQGTPTVGFLPKGTYEIILEMLPSPKQPVKAGIAPATIKFSVQ